MKNPSSTTGSPTAMAARAVELAWMISLAPLLAPGAAHPSDLTIASGVLLSWPERSTETNIVVGADSPEGPWVPCLEPIYTGRGKLAVTVPFSADQQYFQLAPGFPIFDDCSGKPGPWNASFFERGRFQMTHTNGVLHITARQGEADRAVIWPFNEHLDVADASHVSDFATSIDILSWKGIASGSVGILGRAYHQDQNNLYFGLLTFQAGATVSLQLLGNFSDVSATLKSTPCRADPSKSHRLVFTGTGSRLAVRLLELGGRAEPVASLVATNSRILLGNGGIFLNAGFGASDFDMTLDNWVYIGARP